MKRHRRARRLGWGVGVKEVDVMLHNFVLDLRFAARILRKKPLFALVTIATLTLGIGANSAIFSVTRSVLLHPFPYRNADRLLTVSSKDGGGNPLSLSFPDYMDLKAQAGSFEALACAQPESVNVSVKGLREQMPAAFVSHDLFPLLGVDPLLGRVFTDEEDRPDAAPVVVISHGLWHRRFGADPAVLGSPLLVDGRDSVVVGVMPPRFKFWGADLWMPVGLIADSKLTRNRFVRNGLTGIGNLKDGVTEEQARLELDAIAARLAETYPESNAGIAITFSGLLENVVSGIRPMLLVLLGTVGFVLLIACANVASLLLARSIERAKEVSIRQALGAGRGRVVRQLLTESLLLAVLGGAAAVGFAYLALDILKAVIPADSIPAEASIRMDWTALGFTFAVSVVAGLIFGLAPAWHSTSGDLQQGLREGGWGAASGRRGRRIHRFLVIGEVALATVLLAGAGLMMRSLLKLSHVDPGFQSDNLLTVDLSLDRERYQAARQVKAFADLLIERAKGLPKVLSASVSTGIPFGHYAAAGIPYEVEGRPRTRPTDAGNLDNQYDLVSPGYFGTLGIPLLKGRTLEATDSEHAVPVVVIDEQAARNFFGGEDPIGRRIRISLPEELAAQFADQLYTPWMTVVGVVGGVKNHSLRQTLQPHVYASFQQSFLPSAPNDGQAPSLWERLQLTVRTEGQPSAALMSALRSELAAADADSVMVRISPMGERISETLQQPRFGAVLLAVFAAAALTLSCVGIFGVMAHWVLQRTQEIGIRIALGAERGAIFSLVAGQGLLLALVGMVLGLAGALALSRTLSSYLFEISATDPATLAGVAAVLLGAVFSACWIPARRAARVDPIRALKG